MISRLLRRNFSALLNKYLIIFLVSLTAFHQVKAQGVYEVFIISDTVTQYFIHPITYQSDEKEILRLDFTFRDPIIANSVVTLNFSYLSKNQDTTLNALSFLTKEKQETVQTLKKLYIEKQKKQYHMRYTGTISYNTFKKFFQGGQIQLDNGQKVLFSSTKKTLKKNNSITFMLENIK